MSEHKYLKLPSLSARYTWKVPGTDCVFEWQAATGVTMMDIDVQFLSCITRVLFLELEDGTRFDEWIRDPDPARPDVKPGPPIDWRARLYPNIANALFTKIGQTSNLDTRERRDSRSPSGAQNGATTTDATNAAARDGSARDGKERPTKDGNVSRSRRPRAGTR